MKVKTNSQEETFKHGEEIGKKIKSGDIIFLSGILGSGKTVLVRGIASGLGIKEKITSPTFNIFRVYNSKKGSFYHFDCYRLNKYKELKDLGWEELVNNGSIIVLEWPECIKDKNLYESLINRGESMKQLEIKLGKNKINRIIEYK